MAKTTQKKTESPEQLTQRLVELFKKHSGELFKTNEISKMIGIRSDDSRYQELRGILRSLEDQGTIMRGSRRRFGIPTVLPSKVSGVLKIERAGYGTVKPDPNTGMNGKIHIVKNDIAGAKTGDKVIVLVHTDKNPERPSGEIIDIIESRLPIAAPIKKQSDKHPLDPFKRTNKTITTITLRDPEPPIPLERPDPTYKEEIDRLRGEHGLPGEFPKAVLQDVARFSEEKISEEIKSRLDLRKEIIFTIDPEDAKDFDDAISLVENDDWTLTLGVHIADVSHFVREGTALDDESLERGTSVYLAGGVIPMLPEQLSNDLCSLKPDVERLTFSVLMTIDPLTGKVKHSEFKKSVIKSAMRFSYEEAETRITTGRGKYAKLLKSMSELSKTMYLQRRKEGSIDFETTEVRFRFDESGTPTEAYKKDRLGSMKMIEEFMLAANRVVAEYISKKAIEGNEKPFLYRIHADPDPDKVREIARLAKTLGYSLNPEKVTPKIIQKFLDSVKGKPEEQMINTMMLRAMAKAVYAEHNVGHFGLAFIHYTHFTSPIRRYPDLIIHRMLEEYLAHDGMPTKREHHYYQILPEIADHTSAMERRATEAERDSAKIAGLFVMKPKVGEVFDGVVTGVQHYGIFVGLENGAEGLLHIRELKGYYMFDEANGILSPQRSSKKFLPHQRRPKVNSTVSYKVGNPVRVKLVRVNFEKRGLDFVLAEE